MKKLLTITMMTSVGLNSWADTITVKYPKVYPFSPIKVEEIYSHTVTVTEDLNFIKNLKDMIKPEMVEAHSKQKPWTSSYWPLTKGTVADPYENSSLGYSLDLGWVAWKGNYEGLIKRRAEVHPIVSKLTQKQLDKLAPSEKYDILLGDKSFDFTNRTVDYMNKWGSQKDNAFISYIALAGEKSLDLAKDYVATWPAQNESVEAVFRNSWHIKDTLSAKYSLELYDSGKYSSVEDAFPEALRLAKMETKHYVLKKKNSRMAS